MTSPRSAEHTRALLMLVVANFYWGLSFPVIKALTLLHARLVPEAGSWFTTIYTIAPRFLLAIVLLAVTRPGDRGRTTAAEWRQGLLLGAFATAGMLLQNDGLQFTAASTSAFLTQFSAILIPVWLAARARRNPGWLVWICCALVLAGVAVLGRFNPLHPLDAGAGGLHFGRGEIETLLSSLFFMGQILTLSRADFAANRPEKITFVMFAFEAVAFWLLAFVTAPHAGALLAPWKFAPWLGLTALLTVFCTIGSFSLMNRWQPKISATEAGLIYCIEPIFGSLMALFLPAWFSRWAQIDYPNEAATWTLLLGGGLITIANVLLQLKPPPRVAG